VRIGFDALGAQVASVGAARYVHELERALLVLGMDVVPVGARDGAGGGTPRRIARGIYREAIYYPWRFERLARAAGCDLVHFAAALPGLARRLPAVVTVNDLLALQMPELFPRVVRLHTRHVLLPRAAKAACVVTPSEHARRELLEATPLSPERVFVTPYGRDERFVATEPDRDWLRTRFGVDGRIVLAVGTLEPRKNLVTALRAFETVAAAGHDATLVVVGGQGWKNEAFEAALRATSAKVVLAGHVHDDELVRLYGAARCLVFPSLGEGFGFPPLEAMACGTPVVAGDTTSVPEVVGDAGILIPPRDAEAFAGAIESLLVDDDLHGRLRERSLARASAFTWSRCAAQTAEAYERALEGWSAGRSRTNMGASTHA